MFCGPLEEPRGSALQRDPSEPLIQSNMKVRWPPPCMVAILKIISYSRQNEVDRYQGEKKLADVRNPPWSARQRGLPPPIFLPLLGGSVWWRKPPKHSLGEVHLAAWAANLKRAPVRQLTCDGHRLTHFSELQSVRPNFLWSDSYLQLFCLNLLSLRYDWSTKSPLFC